MKQLLIGLSMVATVLGGLTGCSTGTLRDVTSETGGTSTDILYEEALTNIAMIHFYSCNAILPSSYEINSGNVAVNDTASGTAGGSYASITHLFTPNVSFNGQRVFQKSWGVATQDNLGCLKALQTVYDDYANGRRNGFSYLQVKDPTSTSPAVHYTPGSISYPAGLPSSASLFHYSPPGVVDYIQGKYRGTTVWIDPSDQNAICMVNHLVEDMLNVIQSTDAALAATSGGKTKPQGGGGGGGAPASEQPQILINTPTPVRS